MPVIMRCMAVHKHQSGFPRDNVVNTFHFRVPNGNQVNAESCAENVRDFYTVAAPGFGSPFDIWFSDVINDTGHEVRCYAIDEATGVQLNGEGADPIHVEPFDHLGRVGGNQGGLPSEVALCLSYKADGGAGPARRRRGRVYLGPFRGDVIAEDPGTERPMASAGFRANLIAMGKMLRDAATADGNPWVVYSRPFPGRFGAVKDNGDPKPDLPARPGTSNLITSFFVDDAWDTVRRRGERAVSRSTGS